MELRFPPRGLQCREDSKLAKNDKPQGQQNRKVVGQPSNAPKGDDWKDDEAEAEVRSNDAANQASRDAQLETQGHAEKLKEGFFEKVVHKVKDVLHIDEPQHLHHHTGDLHPEERERVKEAHKVELGEDGEFFKEMPINKVPGKLRKFMADK